MAFRWIDWRPAFMGAVLLGLIAAHAPLQAQTTQPSTVKIDPGEVACVRFMGFGAEWDSRGHMYNRINDRDFALIKRRAAWMRLPVARVMMVANWCYAGQGRYTWDKGEMRSLYRVLDACQAMGTTVILTDWGVRGEWVALPGIKDVNDPEYARIIGTYLDHLINRKGYTCIKYFVLLNEPELCDLSFDQWERALRTVAAEIQRRKLDESLTLAGPDETYIAIRGLPWYRESVGKLKGILGAYDFHLYAGVEFVKRGELEALVAGQRVLALAGDSDAKRKPLILGECGMLDGKRDDGRVNAEIDSYDYGLFMADYAVQAAQAGAWTVVAWMLDDNGQPALTWGMWAPKAERFKLRPWFYSWSLMARNFPAGAVIYRLPRIGADLRVLAARIPAKDKGRADDWSVCVVNRGQAEARLVINVPQQGELTFVRYVYGPNIAAKDENGFPKTVGSETLRVENGIPATCPADSVMWLTSKP